MKNMKNIKPISAIATALIAPPLITYGLSSLIPQRGLDVFSVIIIEVVAFALAATILRPRATRVLLAALVYFPSMFIVIFWIGYRAGFYDLP